MADELSKIAVDYASYFINTNISTEVTKEILTHK